MYWFQPFAVFFLVFFKFLPRAMRAVDLCMPQCSLRAPTVIKLFTFSQLSIFIADCLRLTVQIAGIHVEPNWSYTQYDSYCNKFLTHIIYRSRWIKEDWGLLLYDIATCRENNV